MPKAAASRPPLVTTGRGDKLIKPSTRRYVASGPSAMARCSGSMRFPDLFSPEQASRLLAAAEVLIDSTRAHFWPSVGLGCPACLRVQSALSWMVGSQGGFFDGQTAQRKLTS